MNKFNMFNWLKGRKREKKVKNDNKKIMVVQNQPKDKEHVISDTFIDTIPIRPSSVEKENEHKKDENNIKHFKNDDVISNIFSDTIPTRPSSIKKEKKDHEKDINNDKDEQTNNVSSEINIQKNILDSIEIMLKDNYYEITRTKYELEVLEQQEKDELTIKETDKLIDKLNDLIKEFERLKREFYAKNYDKLDIEKANDPYINDLISDYKSAIKNNDVISIDLPQVEKIEQYMQIINTLVSIEKTTTTLNINLEDKKDKLEDADKGIEKVENEYKSVEKVNAYIETFSNQQDSIIKELNRKIENSINITKTAEYKSELYINYSRLLTATLLMAATPIIPPTRSGNLLKIGLIAASVANLAGMVKTRTKEYKVTTKACFIDYESSIKSSLDNVNDMDSTVNKSIKDINTLKKSFIKDFYEYKDVIPEYTSLLVKLDTLEKELISKSKIAKEFEEKLKDTLNNNKVKIKRLEEEHFN